MTRTAAIVLVVLIIILSAHRNAAVGASAPRCEQSGQLVRIPDLAEASGIAASRRLPGRIWAHNDSGDPELVALDARGSMIGRVRVSGAKVEDWEALAVGPCPDGSCLYIGDIGNNDGRRGSITIYRVPEPQETSGTVVVRDAFHARYPAESQDAEALIVTARGEMLIVTKGETGPVSVFRVPADAAPGAVVQLEPVGKPRQAHKAAPDERITDGAISPSGAWIVLRTTRAIVFHRTDDLLAGNWQERSRLSLEQLKEPQGEGVTFGDEKTIYLVGEGGGGQRPGTFGRLTCAL